MITKYNEYISRLLALSRLYRDNPAADHKFTAQEIQLIHKSAAAFEEMVYNIRMSLVNEKLTTAQSTEKNVASAIQYQTVWKKQCLLD